MNLVVRLKCGNGRKTYVWFSEDDGYHIHYMMRDEDGLYIGGQHNGITANEAANIIFNHTWWGRKLDGVSKFYIRRAKAGIAIIDHAKEHGW